MKKRRKTREVLKALFAPRGIAVIGSSWQSPLFLQVLNNLAASRGKSRVWPVILGPERQMPPEIFANEIDLAILVIPVSETLPVLRSCDAAGVAAALLIQSPEGTSQQRADAYTALREELTDLSIRVLGPNSAGLMLPGEKFNASVIPGTALTGSVAFLSQSGALCNAILDWSLCEQIGFSAFVSVGAMVDISWGELLTWLGDHAATRSIIIYMESIGEARAFLSAARETTLSKPVIVIKAGRTETAARAVAAHSFHPAGDDAVLEAAFRRIGVLWVESIAELFYMAEVLSRQPLPSGNRLMIVSNSGSAGVLAADSLTTRGGAPGHVPEGIAAELRDRVLVTGFVDIGEDADAERYSEVLGVLQADADTDGTLVVYAPTIFTPAEEVAGEVIRFAHSQQKPVLASWIGGNSVQKGTAMLERAGIPTFPYPDTAAKIFNYMWRYAYNLRALYETPALVDSEEKAGERRACADELLQKELELGREELSADAAARLLAAYGLDVSDEKPAGGQSYPCAMGSFVDAEFGPVLYFSATAQGPVPASDRTLALPPLNTTLARRMLEQTRFYQQMQAEGRVDLNKLEQALVGFSRMLVELPRIHEVRLDPLFLHIDESGGARPLVAACRIRLFGKEVPDARLPRPAIRPYPIQYVGEWHLRDGTPVLIRPIRPEDEPKFVAFHKHLSDQSVYFRYFHTIQLDQRIAHERLSRICFVDYDREMALVVETATGDEQNIIAVGRLIRAHGDDEAEFAILVADKYQRSGIGTELLRRLVTIGAREGLARITAKILPENSGMLQVCRKIGFDVRFNADEEVYDAVIAL